MKHAIPPNPLCAANAAALVLALSAAAPAIAADANVEVRPDGFLWAGQHFDEVDRLAAVLLPRTPATVALRACGAEAVPRWKAAAHLFRWLELHLSVDAAACPAPLLASLTPVGGATPGDAGAAAEAWWAQLMP